MTQASLANVSESTGDVIRSEPCPRCYLCQTPGEMLYEGMRDRLFGAPGEWNLRQCSNPECGVIWLDPMPLEADIGKAYRTYFTHKGAQAIIPDGIYRRFARRVKSAYLADEFGFGANTASRFEQKLWSLPVRLSPLHRAMFDFPFRLLAVRRKGNLLEVGCGDGGSLEIARQFGWSTVGLDFDSKAVANAQAKGLDVRHGRLQDVHLADSSFDMILMNHVIEHVHDPLGLLRECYRILRPGGRLAMLTPNSESWGCSYFQGDWRGLEPPRHIHIFNYHTLRELGRKAGFTGANIYSPTRSAGWMLLQSRIIYRTRLGLSPLRLSRFRVWLFSSCVVVIEELMSKLWPLRGEELRFEAEK